MISDYSKHIIALSRIKGIGPAFMKKHRAVLLDGQATPDFLANISPKVTTQKLAINLSDAQKIAEDCEKHGIQILTIIDEAYPALLLEIKNPPPVLFLKGNLENLNDALAIVGTRKASAMGKTWAEKTSRYFSRNFAICNGLADGIDLSAISPQGKTVEHAIGVLGSGLDTAQVLSQKKHSLAESVLSNHGLLISEHEPGKKETPFSTMQACRIQAGISKGLILVQGPLGGGSKYTFRAFSEVARPVGVVCVPGIEEYESSELFSANRKIISLREQGIGEFSGIKKVESVKTKEIIPISNSIDFQLMRESLYFW